LGGQGRVNSASNAASGPKLPIRMLRITYCSLYVGGLPVYIVYIQRREARVILG